MKTGLVASAFVIASAATLFSTKEALAAGKCVKCPITIVDLGPGTAALAAPYPVNLVWINLNNLFWTTPACNNSQWMTFSVVGDRGKALLALVQSAILAGKLIDLTGTGTCFGTFPNNVEEVSEIYVYP